MPPRSTLVRDGITTKATYNQTHQVKAMLPKLCYERNQYDEKSEILSENKDKLFPINPLGQKGCNMSLAFSKVPEWLQLLLLGAAAETLE